MTKLSAFILILATTCTALAGHSEGNGGDMCENRFKIVRGDIASWLNRGGADVLVLPPPLSAATYSATMMENIAQAKIVCVDEGLFVGGNSKTCVNSIDPSGQKNIVCNANRFLATSPSDQYILVHHEYAGLSGYEVTTDGDSDYSISNQLLPKNGDGGGNLKIPVPPKCRDEAIVGTFAGMFTSETSRPSFPVKIVIFPDLQTPANPGECPVHRVEYSRPDLISGAGTLIASAQVDLQSSTLLIQSRRISNTGVPGHDILTIRSNQFGHMGFIGQMDWWDRYGVVNVMKCKQGDRVSNTGQCY